MGRKKSEFTSEYELLDRSLSGKNRILYAHVVGVSISSFSVSSVIFCFSTHLLIILILKSNLYLCVTPFSEASVHAVDVSNVKIDNFDNFLSHFNFDAQIFNYDAQLYRAGN